MEIRIMIVEDDEVLARELASYLQRWGFLVTCVKDFQKVMQDFLAFLPQLVLLDVNLPSMMVFTGVDRFVRSVMSRSFLSAVDPMIRIRSWG